MGACVCEELRNVPLTYAIYAERQRDRQLRHELTGIYIFHPTIPGYPKARFPGVVVFSEIYQGMFYSVLLLYIYISTN